MKRERKMYVFQLLINASLLVSILLTGIIAYFISHRPGGVNYSSQPFLLALFDVALLILVFIAVSVLVNKFFLRLSSSSPHIDGLTGFMTRHNFRHVFEQEILDSKCSHQPLSILLIDVDHFRLVNERYGHRVGDELLIMLGSVIQSVLRASDVSCRWGDDQIFVTLKNCTERDACRRAKNILEKLSQQTLNNKGVPVSITASIGVAQMVGEDDVETLVIRAETGLCSARDNGRNTFAIGYEWILIDYSPDPIF